jgi:HK97 family phage prohead protease
MTVIERTRQKKRFAVDIPFTKMASKGPEADDGDLVLTGYANTWVQDRDGDWMAMDAFDKSLPNYLSKNPILLYQHDMRKPLGVVNEMFTDDTGLFAKCTVFKPQEGEEDWKFTAYHDCRRGVLRTFSIGGFFTYDIENFGEEDEKWIIAEVELLELSVVSIPSNPDSVFEAAVKAFGDDSSDGTPGARLSDKAFEQMLQLLGVEEITDPELVSMEDDRRQDRYRELAALFTRVKGREAPDLNAYRQIIEPLSSGETSLAEKLAVLPAIDDLVESLYAPPNSSAKAGRVLSKANEDRLQQAVDLLSEILEQVRSEDPAVEE